MEHMHAESDGSVEGISSWFSTSQMPMITRDDDEAWVDFFLMSKMDNLSFLCDRYENDDNAQCADCPVAFAKILRWTKLIVLAIARNYYAHSAVLVVLPLLVGLVIGYIVGKGTRSTNRALKVTENKWLAAAKHLKESCSSAFLVVVSYLPLFLFAGLGTPVASASSSGSPAVSDLSSHTMAKKDLRSDRDTRCESGVDEKSLPRHIAVIMDGNRRYGKAHHGNKTAGHEAGGRKVMEFAKWCIAEKIKHITLFAFSTENWKRDPAEVSALMSIFLRHCEEMLEEARPRNICVRFLSTYPTPLPAEVRDYISKIESDTRDCDGLFMNVCLSYGSRDEIVRTCRVFARECHEGRLKESDITERSFSERLLTKGMCDPDVLIRTSGEVRISNFLLWQLAYSELFFLNKAWPAVEKDDLLEIIRSYAGGRQRRYGK